MITGITKFETIDDSSAKKLELLFIKLSQETTHEKSLIAYEVLSVKDFSIVYYFIEKWHSKEDLINHSELVTERGYITQTDHLLQNKINIIIINNLNR